MTIESRLTLHRGDTLTKVYVFHVWYLPRAAKRVGNSFGEIPPGDESACVAAAEATVAECTKKNAVPRSRSIVTKEIELARVGNSSLVMIDRRQRWVRTETTSPLQGYQLS